MLLYSFGNIYLASFVVMSVKGSKVRMLSEMSSCHLGYESTQLSEIYGPTWGWLAQSRPQNQEASWWPFNWAQNRPSCRAFSFVEKDISRETKGGNFVTH